MKNDTYIRKLKKLTAAVCFSALEDVYIANLNQSGFRAYIFRDNLQNIEFLKSPYFENKVISILMSNDYNSLGNIHHHENFINTFFIF